MNTKKNLINLVEKIHIDNPTHPEQNPTSDLIDLVTPIDTSTAPNANTDDFVTLVERISPPDEVAKSQKSSSTLSELIPLVERITSSASSDTSFVDTPTANVTEHTPVSSAQIRNSAINCTVSKENSTEKMLGKLLYNGAQLVHTEECDTELTYYVIFRKFFYRLLNRKLDKTKIVSGKTIEEDVGIWKRYIANTKLAEMNILDIKPKHIKEVFDTWTGNGLITRKAFNNRKSVLNGIFDYAVINEIIERNPITSLSCSELKFKNSVPSQKAYTKDERQKLLDYLATLGPDAYVLAITLAFYGIFRIGEIKGLVWDGKSNAITIQQQLVEERILQDDFSFSAPIRVLKDPKGNPHYSIRKEYLPDVAIEALNQMKALNPDGELLFMHRGRPLTTDTFNNRLKKYCGAVGIPYLSSHKIRFTNASILRDEGVDPIDIQPLLGHSNLAMTQHYIEQHVSNMDDTQMAKILA